MSKRLRWKVQEGGSHAIGGSPHRPLSVRRAIDGICLMRSFPHSGYSETWISDEELKNLIAWLRESLEDFP